MAGIWTESDVADEPGKGRKQARHPLNLVDRAHLKLQELIAAKGAERASGRFGVIIVLDRGQQTGIRYSIDEAIFVN